jgi:hypothetical protein
MMSHSSCSSGISKKFYIMPLPVGKLNLTPGDMGNIMVYCINRPSWCGSLDVSFSVCYVNICTAGYLSFAKVTWLNVLGFQKNFVYSLVVTICLVIET